MVIEQGRWTPRFRFPPSSLPRTPSSLALNLAGLCIQYQHILLFPFTLVQFLLLLRTLHTLHTSTLLGNRTPNSSLCTPHASSEVNISPLQLHETRVTMLLAI